MAGFILALQVVAYNRTTSKVDDFLNNEVSLTLPELISINSTISSYLSSK